MLSQWSQHGCLTYTPTAGCVFLVPCGTAESTPDPIPSSTVIHLVPSVISFLFCFFNLHFFSGFYSQCLNISQNSSHIKNQTHPQLQKDASSSYPNFLFSRTAELIKELPVFLSTFLCFSSICSSLASVTIQPQWLMLKNSMYTFQLLKEQLQPRYSFSERLISKNLLTSLLG